MGSRHQEKPANKQGQADATKAESSSSSSSSEEEPDYMALYKKYNRKARAQAKAPLSQSCGAAKAAVGGRHVRGSL